jgi:hypothetical protein
MKFVILASVLVSAFANVSFASELCGTFGSHTVGPKCNPGSPCPMWMRLQYDLTTSEGTRYNIDISNTALFENVSQLIGNQVCVTGTESNGEFDVETISEN